MAGGVISGLIAWLVASVFLHAASIRVLYTVLAVGVGMDIVLRERYVAATRDIEAHESSSFGGAVSVSAQTRLRVPLIQRPPVIGAFVFLVAAASSWLVFGAAPQRWVAERHVLVTTGEEADGRYEAYNYDLITRGLIGATYAAVLEDPELTRHAIADLGWDEEDLGSIEVSTSYVPARQVITIRVAGDDPNQVRAMAARIVGRGVEFVMELDEPFVVAAVESDLTEVHRGPTTDLWRIALIAAVSTAAAVGIGGLVSVTTRRSPANHGEPRRPQYVPNWVLNRLH
jgi:hypothetical protein